MWSFTSLWKGVPSFARTRIRFIRYMYPHRRQISRRMASVEMDLEEIYASCLGAILLIFIGWHLAEALVAWRRRVERVLRKYTSQSLIWPRRNGSTDLNVAAALGLLALAAGNITACAVGVRNLGQLVARLGVVSTVNLVPLYLGGRTSIFADRICGLSLTTSGIIHRWLGRICLLEAFAHGFLALHLRGWKFSVLMILVSLYDWPLTVKLM